MKHSSREHRLALFLRDGLACVYCGNGIESGTQLTLDFIKRPSNGGRCSDSNMVTSCVRCNAARGTRNLRDFRKALTEFREDGTTWKEIATYVRNCARRGAAIKKAKAVLAKRGDFI